MCVSKLMRQRHKWSKNQTVTAWLQLVLSTTFVFDRIRSTIILDTEELCVCVCVPAVTHDLSMPQMACPDVTLPQTHMQKHTLTQDAVWMLVALPLSLFLLRSYFLFSLLSLPVCSRTSRKSSPLVFNHRLYGRLYRKDGCFRRRSHQTNFIKVVLFF